MLTQQSFEWMCHLVTPFGPQDPFGPLNRLPCATRSRPCEWQNEWKNSSSKVIFCWLIIGWIGKEDLPPTVFFFLPMLSNSKKSLTNGSQTPTKWPGNNRTVSLSLTHTHTHTRRYYSRNFLLSKIIKTT